MGQKVNFEELANEVFARGFSYLNRTEAGRDRVRRWVNQAYASLCEIYPWPFLETEQTGVPPLVLSDLRLVLSVRDAVTHSKLEPITTRDVFDETLVGTPGWYYLQDTTLHTYPVGTGQISVRYIFIPAVLTGTADPVVPERFHDIIVDWAVHKGYKDADQFERAAALRAEIDRDLMAMAASLMVRTSDPIEYVAVTDPEAYA